MSYNPIRTSRRLSQWSRWIVFAHIEPVHYHNRIAGFQNGRALRPRTPNRQARLNREDYRPAHRAPELRPRRDRRIGYVYAGNHADAIHLARRALRDDVGLRLVTKIARLEEMPLTPQEYGYWLGELALGIEPPKCGPMVDRNGFPVECFVPV